MSYIGSQGRVNKKNALILLELLRTEPLDPTFEKYGNFVSPDTIETCTHFFGNFANYSFVFNFRWKTSEPICQNLIAAIRENQKRPDYAEAKRKNAERDANFQKTLNQPKPKSMKRIHFERSFEA